MAFQRTDDTEIMEISEGDLIKLHASRAAKALGISTESFWARWASGELAEELEEGEAHPDIARWVMLMSVGRKQPR